MSAQPRRTFGAGSRLRAISTLVATFLIASGCLTGDGPAEGPAAPAATLPANREVSPDRLPQPAFDFSKAIDPTHGGVAAGHSIPALHTGAHGLRLVGYHALSSALGPGAGWVAIDTWQTYLCVAQYYGAGGAVIVDVSDPRNPNVVSSLASTSTNPDCQFTDDGKYLILAGEPGQGDTSGQPAAARAAVGADLAVFDVSNKRSPQFLFSGAGQGSYHNLFTAQIHGTHYVFHPYGGPILALDIEAKRFRVVSTTLKTVHDLWVGQHPITGDWIAATGSGRGTAIYNLNDPAQPVLLGEWAGDGRLTGWHRQWPLSNTVDGRALMVVAGESGGASLPYTVLDFTDPSDLSFVGQWTLPGNPSMQSTCYGFSPHEYETWDGYVATGNYHAGVWLFDIGSSLRAAEPATIGFYLPHENPHQRSPGAPSIITPDFCVPDVWGAYFDDRGYIYAADAFSGLYVLSFDATLTS